MLSPLPLCATSPPRHFHHSNFPGLFAPRSQYTDAAFSWPTSSFRARDVLLASPTIQQPAKRLRKRIHVKQKTKPETIGVTARCHHVAHHQNPPTKAKTVPKKIPRSFNSPRKVESLMGLHSHHRSRCALPFHLGPATCTLHSSGWVHEQTT